MGRRRVFGGRELKTATKIKDGLLQGNARLYRLSAPHRAYDGKEYEYVIVSAAAFAYETYIFPANKAGEVVSWLEMPGSEQGTQSHERVLRNAGYEVV